MILSAIAITLVLINVAVGAAAQPNNNGRRRSSVDIIAYEFVELAGGVDIDNDDNRVHPISDSENNENVDTNPAKIDRSPRLGHSKMCMINVADALTWTVRRDPYMVRI